MMKQFRWIAWVLLIAVMLCATGASVLAEQTPERTPAPARGTVPPRPSATPTAEPTGDQAAEPTPAPAQPDSDGEVPQSDVYDDGEKIELGGAADPLEGIDGARNILLVGLDARPGQSTGRSDTMILCTLDADGGAIKLTSFMRDMYVSIPGKGANRMNAAWVYGGSDLLLATVKENFGVAVEDYVAVDFSLLADVIDEMGGLTLTVDTSKQLSAINGVIKEDNVVLGLSVNDGLLEKTGEQLMTGKQAQAYARYRKGESDFTRTERQREVIIKCLDKLDELPLLSLTALATKTLEKVTTNLTVADVLQLLPAAIALREANVEQLRIPADGAYESKTIKGMSVLKPNLDKNRAILKAFLSD